MSQKQVLLVEGTDDQHVIWALLNAHDIREKFDVERKGGVDNLLRMLPVQLKGSAVSTVGIVLDADVDVSLRWNSVRSIMKRSGYKSFPASPYVDGTVVVEQGLPKVGIWLMPDNVVTGMLEDFIGLLVPERDVGFLYAYAVLSALPAGVQRFAPGRFSKAHIHTWLAWQQDPGTPLGLALTKKYLDAGAPSAVAFVKWLKELFS